MEKLKDFLKKHKRSILVGVTIFALLGLISPSKANLSFEDKLLDRLADRLVGVFLTKDVGSDDVFGAQDITQNTQTGSFTDGGDLLRNIQAFGETLASTTDNFVLQADSQGRMQPISPSALEGSFTFAGLTASGGLTSSGGDARIASLVNTGATSTLTASTTDMTANLITAANVCDSGLVAFSIGNTTTPTWTLPATGTLFADCLTTDGDEAVLTLLNTSANTSTVIAIGSGGTIDAASSTTLLANNTAKLWILRVTADAYRAMLTTFNN